VGDPEIPGSAIPPGPIAYHQHYLCLELLVLHGAVENVNRQLASHVRTLRQAGVYRMRRVTWIGRAVTLLVATGVVVSVGSTVGSDASARDD
jgi:hypothetical protein